MLEEIIQKNSTRLDPLATGVEPLLNRIDGGKAILFDIYGTLFISGSGDVGTATAVNTAKALQQALEAAGFEGDLKQAGQLGKQLLKAGILESHEKAKAAGIDYPEVKITAIWQGILDQMIAERILQSGPESDDQVRRLAVEYECRVNPVYPMPGSLETITELRRGNRILGIVSNAQFYTLQLFPAFFRQSVEATGFDPGCCIWSYQEGRAKPSAGLFPKALHYLKEAYGIHPRETVYVGNDMLNDMYCAGQAGCRTVLFAGDRRSLRMRENDERCLAVQPDAVITCLTQLGEIL